MPYNRQNETWSVGSPDPMVRALRGGALNRRPDRKPMPLFNQGIGGGAGGYQIPGRGGMGGNPVPPGLPMPGRDLAPKPLPPAPTIPGPGYPGRGGDGGGMDIPGKPMPPPTIPGRPGPMMGGPQQQMPYDPNGGMRMDMPPPPIPQQGASPLNGGPVTAQMPFNPSAGMTAQNPRLSPAGLGRLMPPRGSY